jgi:2-polyprenyl-6-methoxyphenol hydroxylase-like FAD-dependent oxidoreductase
VDALIIGGGIAGAVTAMALRKAGFGAVVYEAYPTGADDVGAFLTIMPNGMDALRAIGAHQQVIDVSFPAKEIRLYDGSGVLLGTRPAGAGESGVTSPRTLKRATLYRALHDEAARRGVPIEHGKRLEHAERTSSGRVLARFADGSTARGDLLVGADGIHSVTRRLIDPGAPEPRYTGLNIVYGYTRGDGFPPATDSYRMIQGHKAFFGYTTSPEGETFWFARLPASRVEDEITAAGWKERALEFFAGDDTPSSAIINATGEDIVGSNGFDVPVTPRWFRPPMVLAGDAAHAASPAAGQGASMALEDSVLLAKCLRDLPDIEPAFESYVDIRRARVERLVAASAGQDSARPGIVKRLRRFVESKRPKRDEDRNWLYDHHIDWDEKAGE